MFLFHYWTAADSIGLTAAASVAVALSAIALAAASAVSAAIANPVAVAAAASIYRRMNKEKEEYRKKRIEQKNC